MTIKVKVLNVFFLCACLAFTGCGGTGTSTQKVNPEPPSFTSTPPTSATQGVAYSYKIAATDPSGGTVAFSLTSGPSSSSISNSTLAWTPTAAQTGVKNNFTITATTSEGESATQSWSVTPSTGPAPTFTSTPPVSATEGTAYTYNLSATDSLGGTVSFALTSGPGTMTGADLTWTPTHAQSRTADNFTVTASTSEGGTATQSWTVTPAGTINGTDSYTSVLSSGNTVAFPIDLSGTTINALLPNADGSYTAIAGSGSSDGTFTIPGVPAGVYLLQIENGYTQLSASDFNLATGPNTGVYVAGRSGVTYGSASISLTATGFPLLLTQVCDSWWVPNLNLNQTGEGGSCLTNSTPVLGGTVNETIPLYALMDSSQGDEGYYVASVFNTAYTGSQQLITSAYDFGPIPVTTPNGSPVTVTEPVLQIGSFESTEVAVQRSAFAALRSSANPTYAAATTTFSVQPQLYGDMYGPIFYEEPSVLRFTDFSGATSNFDLGSIQFGVFDTGEPLMYEVSDGTFASSTVSGGTLYQFGEVFVDSGSPFTSLSPATPGTGPVVAPAIDGTSFFQSQSNVSSTPTLSWGAPTVGTATEYSLDVEETELTNLCPPPASPCYYWEPGEYVAYFSTAQTKLTIPPGILQAGNSYQFYLFATSAPGFNLLDRQGTVSLDEAGASSFSGLITIAGTSDVKNDVSNNRELHSYVPVEILRQRNRIQRQFQRTVGESLRSRIGQ